MGTHVFIFLLAVSLCNGHIPLIDILTSAHTKINNVAGGVIDGIAHGLKFNAGGSFAINAQANQRPHQSPKPPKEEIIVIVEEVPNSNEQYKPPGNNRPYQNGNRPPFHNNGNYGNGYNDYRPNHNRPGRPHQGNENWNNNGNGNHFNQGPNGYGRPHNNHHNNQNPNYKPNRYPNYPNEGNPDYENSEYSPRPNENNEYNNQNNGYNNNGYYPRPNSGNNYNNRPNRPLANNNQQNNYENNPYLNHNNANNGNVNSDDQIFNKPTTDLPLKKPVTTVKPSEENKTPDNDIPLFVPLLPDENTNKNVNAPKRDTENSKNEDAEEDFELDIRLKEK